MKCLFLFFSSFILSCAQAQPTNESKEIVKKVHLDFINAILAEDYQQVGEILSDDVTLGTPGGGFGTKRDYISALKNGVLFYDSLGNHSFNIRIYGTTGLVNGNVDLVFRYKDENRGWLRMLEHLTFTAVYDMNSKRLQMVAWQSNRPPTDTIEIIRD